MIVGSSQVLGSVHYLSDLDTVVLQSDVLLLLHALLRLLIRVQESDLQLSLLRVLLTVDADH